MKRAGATLAILALLAAAACSTLETTADWDRTTDFAKYRTWTWKDDDSIKNDILAKRIQAGVTAELNKKGLSPTDDNPDLWAVAHARLSKQTRVDYYNSGWGYGWYGGYYGGGMTMSTATVREIPVGTLIVDLVDAKQKKLVWRGIAQDTLKPERSSEEKQKALSEALAKLFENYPPPPGK
jgi:hypothetical protein